MTEQLFEGPFGYENWRAFNRGEPTTDGGEVMLYSDSRFSGELSSELGPFQVLHALSHSEPGVVAPVFALRMDDHLPTDLIEALTSNLFSRKKTILAHYHGGSIYDEIAALLALTHGVRMQAGSPTRWFDSRADPRGRAVTPQKGPPVLMESHGGAAIPRFGKGGVAIRAELIPSYPQLAPPDALALIRAARSYQEAAWISDGDPQLAWLLLVSAVETAAARWARATKADEESSDAEVLTSAKPDLAALLKEAGGDDHLSAVAAYIAQGMRAGHKFRRFLVTFAPKPPVPRPAEWSALDWSTEGLMSALSKVYGHRSKALHESIPFPLPMCGPPLRFDTDGQEWLTETPGSGAAFVGGGVWQHSDTPILLWTFEHLVRGALLNWWALIASTPAGGGTVE
jgi:hypothetical protein